MNRQLLLNYRNLSITDRKILRSKLGDSDKMLKLVDYLEIEKSEDFSSRKVIEFIYGKQNEKISREILTNRYYKLRKKLTEILDSFFIRQDHPAESLPLAEEEALFLKCRQLIIANDISGALKNLKSLLNKSEKLELFELLPDICNQIIYCNQVMNLHQLNPGIMENAQRFIIHNEALQNQKILLRRAQHEYMTEGFQKANLTLKEIKSQSDKFPQSERLRMNYHWGSLIIGTSSFANSPHALSRHLRQVEIYITKNPGKPFLNYTFGHEWNDRFHLNLIKGSFGFLLNKYEMCYNAFKDCFSMIDRIPLLQGRKSEPLYLNKIYIDLITKRYQEALGSCKELEKFIRSQKQTDRMGIVWIQKLRVYLFAYPGLKSPDFRMELKKAKEFIQVLTKEGQKNFVAEYQLWMSIYYYQNKQFKESKKLFRTENVIRLLKDRGLENKKITAFINRPESVNDENKKQIISSLRVDTLSEKNIEKKMYYELLIRTIENHQP